MIRKIHYVVFFGLLFNGCATIQHGLGEQGIIGEVRWVEGNLMPGVGDDNAYAKHAQGKPIKRTIYIYEATKRKEAISGGGAFYKMIKTKLVARVKSGPNGRFSAELPPGKYSLFVLESEGFYANRFDGENYINPVTVQANDFTEIQILVNYKAYY